MAAEVLSAALLLQKKDGDNQDLIRYQLERNAEDDSAHTSAGWMAVMKGDHKKANEHFLEALRLNPMNENARLGLIESFRARSWPYRLQLKFAHFMNQFTEGRQTAIMLGGFICYKVLSSYLKTVSPILGAVVIGAWLMFVLWAHLARGLSSAFIGREQIVEVNVGQIAGMACEGAPGTALRELRHAGECEKQSGLAKHIQRGRDSGATAGGS